MKKSVRLFITGNLQPVFFNNFVVENAEKLGVKGFVRNMEDGRVEIFIEGDIDEVNNMIQVCKRGPAHTQLRNVEEKPERYQGFREFKVMKI